MSMFDKTHKTVLTKDANGKPTAIASSEEVGVFTGAIGYLMQPFNGDTVITGTGSVVGAVASVYGTAQLTRKALGGDFALNPFKA